MAILQVLSLAIVLASGVVSVDGAPAFQVHDFEDDDLKRLEMNLLQIYDVLHSFERPCISDDGTCTGDGLIIESLQQDQSVRDDIMARYSAMPGAIPAPIPANQASNPQVRQKALSDLLKAMVEHGRQAEWNYFFSRANATDILSSSATQASSGNCYTFANIMSILARNNLGLKEVQTVERGVNANEGHGLVTRNMPNPIDQHYSGNLWNAQKGSFTGAVFENHAYVKDYAAGGMRYDPTVGAVYKSEPMFETLDCPGSNQCCQNQQSSMYKFSNCFDFRVCLHYQSQQCKKSLKKLTPAQGQADSNLLPHLDTRKPDIATLNRGGWWVWQEG